MSKISLTRLLNEIKLTEAKINKSVGKSFVSVKTGSNPPTGYSSVSDVEKEIRSNLDSVKDLIAYRNKLKESLTKANATTTVTIGGKVMTIAQAIDKKSSISLDKNLLSNLTKQLANYTSHIDSVNHQVNKNIDIMLQNAFGKDRKVSEEEANAITEPYLKQHKASFIDPVDIRKVIKDLEEDIENFENEVDFCLSEVNAKTEVEI